MKYERYSDLLDDHKEWLMQTEPEIIINFVDAITEYTNDEDLEDYIDWLTLFYQVLIETGNNKLLSQNH